MSKSKAFETLGARLQNPYGWSGLTEDGQVVLQLWRHLLKGKPPSMSYDLFGDPDVEHWKSLPGNKPRIEHLKIARDRWDGRFKVVVGTAEDPMAIPHVTKDAYASKIEMRLIELNEETGEFRAEQIVA